MSAAITAAEQIADLINAISDSGNELTTLNLAAAVTVAANLVSAELPVNDATATALADAATEGATLVLPSQLGCGVDSSGCALRLTRTATEWSGFLLRSCSRVRQLGRPRCRLS